MSSTKPSSLADTVLNDVRFNFYQVLLKKVRKSLKERWSQSATWSYFIQDIETYGDKLQEITDNYIHSITQLLEKAKVKICVSQIISTGRYYPEFNEKAKTLNDFVSSFISYLRSSNKYQNRIFTSNNDKLAHYVTKSTGPNGVQMTLNSRGKNILWLKLRDGFERTLGPSYRTDTPQQQSSKDDKNIRPTYRREDQLTRNSRYNR